MSTLLTLKSLATLTLDATLVADIIKQRQEDKNNHLFFFIVVNKKLISNYASNLELRSTGAFSTIYLHFFVKRSVINYKKHLKEPFKTDFEQKAA